MWDLTTFYKSDEWLSLRLILIAQRLNEEGMTICEHCGKPIFKSYDIILHHTIPLTPENVNNVDISLNPERIQIVHLRCHNRIHGKLCDNHQNIYLVYGSPLSGKSRYVHDNAQCGDIIVDMDSIWECISGCDRYVKPKRLNSNVFGIRDELIRMIRMRVGKWSNAFIVGGYPLISERERLCKTLGAKEIFVDTPKDECIRRLYENPNGRDINEWLKYIDEWWERYGPPGQTNLMS